MPELRMKTFRLPDLRHVREVRPEGNAVRLDPIQRRVVGLPSSRSVLVLGAAGSGKTTVALRRLRELWARARDSHRAFRCAVIVPSDGLVALTEGMMNRTALRMFSPTTLNAWLRRAARASFAGVPEKMGRDASTGSILLKRHPAVRRAVRKLARELGPVRFTEAYDLFYLWSDSRLLDEIVSESKGLLTQEMGREVLQHACLQFSELDEDDDEFARTRTEDGFDVVEGTPLQDAGSLDVEDYPVLFELDRVRAGPNFQRLPRKLLFDHIVIDESQDIAPMELAVLGRGLKPGGALTVVGDERQQTDVSAYFTGWGATTRELALKRPEIVHLEHSYRCPARVAQFSRALLESSVHSPAHGVETGDDLLLTRFADESTLVHDLSRELARVRKRDPSVRMALICRSASDARRLYGLLNGKLPCRWGCAGRGGQGVLSVTHVAEVKGLEFEIVILPDLTPETYPDQPEARRALYVAATRTLDQLCLATTGEWSPLTR